MPSIIKYECDEFTPSIGDKTKIIGMREIVSYVFKGVDVSSLWEILLNRYGINHNDAAALMDLSMILQSQNNKEDALRLMGMALEIQRNFCVVHGDGSGPKILAIVTKGDFMANTPIDFLLANSNAVLWLHYVDEETQEFHNLPKYDVAFMAIGETIENQKILANLSSILKTWKVPILNNNPALIAKFTRDGVSNIFENQNEILVPKTKRINRSALQEIISETTKLNIIDAEYNYPVIIRPIGTHAGHGMVKIDCLNDIKIWLENNDDENIYIFPFIDYRGSDSKFNKQRVVLIKGQPFPSHLAISSHWMVHYMNADMIENAEHRQIEAEWMESFHEKYAVENAKSFAILYEKIGLDYFGLDCAIMPDGKLLMFELDVAMIVHDMDDEITFPYKKPAMHKLFSSFMKMIDDNIAQ